MASSIGAAGGAGGIFQLPSISSLDAGKKSAGAGAGDSAGETAAAGGSSFGELLSNKLGDLNAKQAESGQLMTDLATGKTDDIAQSMMRMQEASIELKMATQVRNKVIDAYQEILRMQI